MGIGTWHEAEIAYRQQRIAADFARARRAPRVGDEPAVAGFGRSRSATFRRLGRALHVPLM